MRFLSSLLFHKYFSSWPFICSMFFILHLLNILQILNIFHTGMCCGDMWSGPYRCLSHCHAVKFCLVVCWHKAFYGIEILYTGVKERHKIDLHVLTIYFVWQDSLNSRHNKHYGCLSWHMILELLGSNTADSQILPYDKELFIALPVFVSFSVFRIRNL